ncbi:TPA: right-handed parallel beta-helix repeat-containing protein [Citrobacter freundii]|nr:right-handed parallel beta-helix repeat-containing protein [Citrobacter freundii]
MSTTPTNLPVPSGKPQDLKFNAGKIDEFVTSMAKQYIDRFGHAHYTIEGLRWVAQQAIAAFGYITLDSFEDGNTLTLPNQVLRLEATGEYYRWDGVFPKDVPAGSTPDSTGGIGTGAWLSVGDATLRSDLSKNTGAGLSGTSSGNTVQEELDKIKLKFNSFAEMRSSTAAIIGDYAYLLGWHAGYHGYGWGVFECVDKTGLTDDGGTIAVAATYAWKRISGPGNATEFGAVPNAGNGFDNKAYLESADAAMGIRLSSGTYYTSPFSIRGHSLIGKGSGTTKIKQIAGSTGGPLISIRPVIDDWSSRIEDITLRDFTSEAEPSSVNIYSKFTANVNCSNVIAKGGYHNLLLEGVGNWRTIGSKFNKAIDEGVKVIPYDNKVDLVVGTFIFFDNCDMSEAGKNGVSVIHTPTVFFSNCTMFYNTFNGIYAAGNSTEYPLARFTAVNISNCDIDSNGDGAIYMDSVLFPDISHNWLGGPRVNTNRSTVVLVNCEDFKFVGNEAIEATADGLTLNLCRRGSVSNNILSGNKVCGLQVSDCSHLSITGNNVSATWWTSRTPQQYGIKLNSGEYYAVVGNAGVGNTVSNFTSNATVGQQIGYNAWP